MTESSFASLSPTLLARKGGAKPAMRPQIAPLDGKASSLAANLEDLGWNDMGETHDAPAPTEGYAGLTPEPVREERASESSSDSAGPHVSPQPSPARRQIAELASRIASNDSEAGNEGGVAPAIPRRSARSQGKRAAFTLRLDSGRHLKLRLASTVKGRSAQALVTEALDRLLADMPELDSMAAHVAQK